MSTKTWRLMPLTFLPASVAALPAAFAGLDGLAVDDAGAGLTLAIVDQPDVVAQIRMNLFQQAGMGPTAKVTVSALPWRQVLGQVAPLATAAQ